MAVLYTPKDEMIKVQPKNGTDFTAAELHEFVGGTFEIVSLEDGDLLICNENYLAEGLPLNVVASVIGINAGVLMGGGGFCGNVLWCKSDEIR